MYYIELLQYSKIQILLQIGVQMEAFSVEDNGAEVCFNVFIYNVQPGVTIDYSTGESSLNTAQS